ncbi:hypothetical protein B0H14DRAFT_2599285 [Mycena olivaceomarginata]|nr:hypothetical protein B0H14DRAFT_2599285 [Mycena olivaceomarginata]
MILVTSSLTKAYRSPSAAVSTIKLHELIPIVRACAGGTGGNLCISDRPLYKLSGPTSVQAPSIDLTDTLQLDSMDTAQIQSQVNSNIYFNLISFAALFYEYFLTSDFIVGNFALLGNTIEVTDYPLLCKSTWHAFWNHSCRHSKLLDDREHPAENYGWTRVYPRVPSGVPVPGPAKTVPVYGSGLKPVRVTRGSSMHPRVSKPVGYTRDISSINNVLLANTVRYTRPKFTFE